MRDYNKMSRKELIDLIAEMNEEICRLSNYIAKIEEKETLKNEKIEVAEGLFKAPNVTINVIEVWHGKQKRYKRF